jgi:hypothetical protein
MALDAVAADRGRDLCRDDPVYAALFEGKPQSLKTRLGVVAPKGYVPSELP